MYTGYIIVKENIPTNTHREYDVSLFTPGIYYVQASGGNYKMRPVGINKDKTMWYHREELKHIWEQGAIQVVSKEEVQGMKVEDSDRVTRGGTSISLSS